MPIRINLLAEQQAAEEARRKDPLKRAIIGGSAAVLLFLVWTLQVHLQVKAKTTELQNLDADFRKVDDKAKVVKNLIVATGDIERRMTSLERYSTNRVLWASMLDAMQQTRMDTVRFREMGTRQHYMQLPTNTFFTTNIMVPFNPPKPAWKFWASEPPPVNVGLVVSNMFKAFTNAAPFATNKLPYRVKIDVVGTNMQSSQIAVKCDFTLPFAATEHIDVTVRGRDYGSPPGSGIDQFLQKILSLPYFVQKLGTGENRYYFPVRAPNQETDILEPGSPPFLQFTLQLNHTNRVMINE